MFSGTQSLTLKMRIWPQPRRCNFRSTLSSELLDLIGGTTGTYPAGCGDKLECDTCRLSVSYCAAFVEACRRSAQGSFSESHHDHEGYSVPSYITDGLKLTHLITSLPLGQSLNIGANRSMSGWTLRQLSCCTTINSFKLQIVNS